MVEAMKMQNSLASGVTGTVKAIHVKVSRVPKLVLRAIGTKVGTLGVGGGISYVTGTVKAIHAKVCF